MILPENGSVVIVDENQDEAIPIIKALAKSGISTTYYTGIKENELPNQPSQIVRLVFLDLQLIEGINDERQIATSLIQILKKIISTDNGPYALVIWSKNYSKFGKSVEDEVKKTEHKIAPICIVNFNKRDCLEEVKSYPVDIEEFTQEIIDPLIDLLEVEEIDLIKRKIAEGVEDRVLYTYKAKNNAVEIIEAAIEEKLQQAGMFYLFVIWENLLRGSGSKTVTAISSTIEATDLWERNMRNVIQRMAKARIGQNVAGKDIILKEALTTFTNSFAEDIESAIRSTVFPSYIDTANDFLIAGKEGENVYQIKEMQETILLNKDGQDFAKQSVSKKNISKLPNGLNGVDKPVATKLIDQYLSIPHVINSKLHIEAIPSNELMPGNIYSIDVDVEKKKKYLPTYFENIDCSLGEYEFIELEVSPICDFAQAKWKRSRLISGVIYPTTTKARTKELFLYNVEPILLIDTKPMRIVFDFHLFKSLAKETVSKREIKFRLKRELLLDIIANLSGQVNRPGISFVA